MVFNLTARLLKEVKTKILVKILFNLIIKNMVNLKKFESRLANKSRFFPGFMILSVTSRCNLVCQGCWVTTSIPKDMPLNVARKVISSCLAKGSAYIGLVGGEPLMYPHLFSLIEEFPNAYFQLFTNGTLLKDKVARQLALLGNVTPLISVEGLIHESDRRRNGKNVYASAMKALENCARHRLLTGVATSVCQTNFDQLVNDDFIRQLIARKVHYLWYYIYRPTGSRPHPELALNQKQIYSLRKFMVEARLKHEIAIIDAYWDADGHAICPGASGLSHHLNPEGFIEFCPPLQFAFDRIEKNENFADKIGSSDKLELMRQSIVSETNGCIILNNPARLHAILKDLGATDTSGRNSAFAELQNMTKKPCHHIPGKEIPEKSFFYRLAKKFSFFGFSAYG